MSSLVSYPWALFVVLFVGLVLVVEIGLHVRATSPDHDAERQSLIKSARDGMTVLLSFLLGFALPMALPHYEQRRNLVADEAEAISTVDQRAQMLPEPFQHNIRALVREYVDARLEFARARDDRGVQASVERAKHLQEEMWEQTVAMARENPGSNVTAIFAQAVGSLADLNERRLTAYETRVPGVIWLVLILVSVLTCFVVGYSMKHRLLLAMIVLPLTVASVLSLASELDSPRIGFIRAGQQSMQRLQLDLKNAPSQ